MLTAPGKSTREIAVELSGRRGETPEVRRRAADLAKRRRDERRNLRQNPRGPAVVGGEARPSRERGGVRYEECAAWSGCLRLAADANWPAMSCEGCAGPFTELGGGPFTGIAPPQIPAPIEAPSKSTTQLSGVTQGEAMANHDKDTSARELAAALKVGVSSIYRCAERLSLPVAGRSAEQHAKLVAEVEAKRTSARGERPKKAPAKKAPPKKLSEAVTRQTASAFAATVQAVIGTVKALEPLGAEQRQIALRIASACLEAGA